MCAFFCTAVAARPGGSRGANGSAMVHLVRRKKQTMNGQCFADAAQAETKEDGQRETGPEERKKNDR